MLLCVSASDQRGFLCSLAAVEFRGAELGGMGETGARRLHSQHTLRVVVTQFEAEECEGEGDCRSALEASGGELFVLV